MSVAAFQQAEDQASLPPAIESEAQLEEIFPNRDGHIGFLIMGVIATLVALLGSGSWWSVLFAPLLIGAIDLVMVVIGSIRKRLLDGQRLVIDPERRVVRFRNFRFRRGLLSRHEADREVPFEHLHGCRRLHGQHTEWLVLITRDGDVTIGEWMSRFKELHWALLGIAGKAPLLSSLLRDRAVQLWLLLMGLGAIGLGMPLLVTRS